jgi:spore photoproduct lyase
MKYYVTIDALEKAKNFLEKKDIKYSVIKNIEDIPKTIKKATIFTINRGKFLMPCPGTPKYICCGYYVLSPVENCPYNCTYCILNAYFKDRHIRIFLNVEDMIEELEEATKKDRIKRIGTGEFSDSMFNLAAEIYADQLLDFFNRNKDIYLELKTKAKYILNCFLQSKYKNIIFSWSMNSKKINKFEELGTSSIEERIELAKMVISKGYSISLHFDPIIEYEGWEKDYEETINIIFKNLDSKAIKWISLGTLRYIPQLKDIAKSLYPKTKIFDNEFILALDGKKRYFRKKRTEIYKKIYNMIKSYDKEVFVYLCMENEDVWYDVFKTKMNSRRLKELMDAQLKK